MGRRRRNNVYRHYMLQEESHTATCLLCFKTLSSIHGSNLMHHLKFMHKTEYQQILILNRKGAVSSDYSPRRISTYSNDEESQSDGLGVVVDVEKFFSLEKGTTRARCDVCQATVERKLMSSHLKQQHPKMLKRASEESDGDEVDDNLYQEVVYLYDSDSKSSKPIKPLKQSAPTPPPKTRSERDSSPKIDRRKRRRTHESSSLQVEEHTEELENFGRYVTCLMKTVPKDLCTQLQMEIINLIMTAKIKNMSKPSTSASLTVNMSDSVSVADSCNANQSVVTVQLEGYNIDETPAPSSKTGDGN